jgi:histidinol-phosphate/aromatic aminotransferase/cobyric acid decarboxylase-like protein
MVSRVPIASLVHPHLAQLTPYQAGKPLEELARELGLTDAIKLASNENPLGPHPRPWRPFTNISPQCTAIPTATPIISRRT